MTSDLDMPRAPPTHRPAGAARPASSWRERDGTRPNANARGYNWRWHKAARAFLAANPLCAEHTRRGKVAAATCVDHIIPHRGDETLFWDRANWQALCKPCHDAKTGRGL